jgi:hypothetical protein
VGSDCDVYVKVLSRNRSKTQRKDKKKTSVTMSLWPRLIQGTSQVYSRRFHVISCFLENTIPKPAKIVWNMRLIQLYYPSFTYMYSRGIRTRGDFPSRLLYAFTAWRLITWWIVFLATQLGPWCSTPLPQPPLHPLSYRLNDPPLMITQRCNIQGYLLMGDGVVQSIFAPSSLP